MFLFMTVGALYIIAEMNQTQNKRLFDNITNIYVLLIDPYISGTLTLVTILVRRKALFALILLHHDIDNKYRALGIKPPYVILTVLAWNCVVAIPAGMISWAIHMYIIHEDAITHLLWRMCFTPCHIMYNYFMCIHIGTLIFIFERFRLLNKTMKSITGEKFSVVCKLLPKTSFLHYRLCEAANRLTKHADLPLLLITLKVYLTTIACVLSFYGMVPQMHSELTVWMSIYWLYFLLCVVLCELINNEVSLSASASTKMMTPLLVYQSGTAVMRNDCLILCGRNWK